MKMIFWSFAIIAGLFLEGQAIADTKFEAENATLSNGASKNTNHTGYSGTGFIDGFINKDAQVSFGIIGATGGNYTLTLHYSAGGGTSTNTGLYVNGTKIKNISCNGTANWDTWADEVETVTLTAGNNTIAYKSETASGSCINIDYLNVNGSLDACAGIQGGGSGLLGATFGLNPPYVAGTEYCKATDGDINTFFDCSQANGAYTGLDLGSAKVIKKIRYYPRINFANRMNGGKFQGSNDGSSYTDLYTISSVPVVQWNEVTISNSTGYRYVRYLSPNNGFGNIAEMEFYLGQTTYSLSVSNDGHGTTSPSGTVTVNTDAATPISATVSAGYLFTNWTITSGTATIADATSASTTVTLSSGDASIQAHFAAHAPTDISLSPSSIAEHLPANTVVGTFSAQDVDYGSTFSFSLASGTGSDNNGSFGIINGNQLVTTSSFDYATKNSYSIRIHVNDNTGQSFEKQFTVRVTYAGAYANPTMTPAPATELTGTAVTISWTPVSGAISYELDFGSTVGGNNLYNGTAGTATSATISSLPNNGSTIYARIITIDPNGPHTYDFTYKAYTERPKALNLAITGTLQVGKVATGSYTYSDADPQGATSFKWYRADDASGTNQTVITGATSATFTMTDAEDGKYILFEVTPRATAGTIDGLPTLSLAAGPVGAKYVYPKVCGANQNMKVDGQIKCYSLLIYDWLLAQKGSPVAPDYVFGKDYKLSSLAETEQYIKANGHLPEVPSAGELGANGVDMIQLNFILLKKIEEITLHMIAQEKEIEELKRGVK